MSIHYEWDNEEKTIIRYDFDGKWTWEEFRDKQTEANALFAEVDHPVDVILDLLKSESRPTNLFVHIRESEAHRPPNHGRLVVVRSGQFVRTMLATYQRLFGSRDKIETIRVDTLEEARERLKRE
jgi:hypothetical protein